ncbi:CDP-diacylglycerol diphosphatase [Rhodanobacter sp. DHG33]|nr:CDP-diacylglycerol diphosphatase [Rhodanobacter sp. DHG33]
MAKRLGWLSSWLLVMGWVVVPDGAKGAALPPRAHQHAEDRSRLWTLVHNECVPSFAQSRFPPLPCMEVDVTRPWDVTGYAVLKDQAGRYQYLVLPLTRITGIESPALQVPNSPNYFAAAWTARLYVEAALHAIQPRDALSLVVNSTMDRSQDQLHIHVDCIRPDVHATLLRLLPAIDGQWRPLASLLPPRGHAYWARWVAGETLPIDPFKSLAASLRAGDSMAKHSLIVVGAYSRSDRPGFVLLSGRVDQARDDHADGEELQDRSCIIARQPPPRSNRTHSISQR